jgi:hypothetical protein
VKLALEEGIKEADLIEERIKQTKEIFKTLVSPIQTPL